MEVHPASYPLILEVIAVLRKTPIAGLWVLPVTTECTPGPISFRARLLDTETLHRLAPLYNTTFSEADVPELMAFVQERISALHGVELCVLHSHRDVDEGVPLPLTDEALYLQVPSWIGRIRTSILPKDARELMCALLIDRLPNPQGLCELEPSSAMTLRLWDAGLTVRGSVGRCSRDNPLDFCQELLERLTKGRSCNIWLAEARRRAPNVAGVLEAMKATVPEGDHAVLYAVAARRWPDKIEELGVPAMLTGHLSCFAAQIVRTEQLLALLNALPCFEDADARLLIQELSAHRLKRRTLHAYWRQRLRLAEDTEFLDLSDECPELTIDELERHTRLLLKAERYDDAEASLIALDKKGGECRELLRALLKDHGSEPLIMLAIRLLGRDHVQDVIRRLFEHCLATREIRTAERLLDQMGKPEDARLALLKSCSDESDWQRLMPHFYSGMPKWTLAQRREAFLLALERQPKDRAEIWLAGIEQTIFADGWQFQLFLEQTKWVASLPTSISLLSAAVQVIYATNWYSPEQSSQVAQLVTAACVERVEQGDLSYISPMYLLICDLETRGIYDRQPVSRARAWRDLIVGCSYSAGIGPANDLLAWAEHRAILGTAHDNETVQECTRAARQAVFPKLTAAFGRVSLPMTSYSFDVGGREVWRHPLQVANILGDPWVLHCLKIDLSVLRSPSPRTTRRAGSTSTSRRQRGQ